MLHLTEGNFQAEVNQAKFPVVVMFYASWCPKCAMTKPVAEDIEKRYRKKVKFCEVEIEECPNLAVKYGADIVPTLVMFKNGTVKARMQGTVWRKYIGKESQGAALGRLLRFFFI